jgi:hypothetical protein
LAISLLDPLVFYDKKRKEKKKTHIRSKREFTSYPCRLLLRILLLVVCALYKLLGQLVALFLRLVVVVMVVGGDGGVNGSVRLAAASQGHVGMNSMFLWLVVLHGMNWRCF